MVDDDKIDDLVRELSETNRNLSRLVDSIVRGQDQQAEDGDEEPKFPVDRVTEGRYSPSVDDIVEYEKAREKAANNDTSGLPTYGGSQDTVDFYTDVFTASLENMDMVSNRLSKDQFDEFVGNIAVIHGVNEELVDILEPSSSFFGVTTDKDKNVVFTPQKSHIPLLQAMGSYWHVDRNSALDPGNITEPWYKLTIGTATQRNNISGEFSIEPERFLRFDADVTELDMDIKMAEIIMKREGKTLPQHLKREYNV